MTVLSEELYVAAVTETNDSKNNSQKRVKKQIKKKKTLVDESIQGTNDSSIVSKRSVERLYWHKKRSSSEDSTSQNRAQHMEFFRYFVPKPQRRAPIINRGYWTRMEAMKSIISTVIKKYHQKKTKVVIVNLGCGFDPYPFQYLAAESEICENAVFLDVDYMDLIKKKVTTIVGSDELSRIIGSTTTTPATGNVDSNSSSHVFLQTPSYVALGCDLRDLTAFEKSLRNLFDVDNSVFLFTAEVSITYMTQESADNLIQWAATLPRVEFALLEQIMPAGENHPFAQTMLKHFNSLKTPLHSIAAYPTVDKQKERFISKGWHYVKVQDLFEFWENDISENDKKFVASVEDFDEWEEFILFCHHYFILHASGGSLDSNGSISTSSADRTVETLEKNIDSIYLHTTSLPKARRKFSAGCNIDDQSLIFHGGMTTNRENTALLISDEKAVRQVTPKVIIQRPPAAITGRMCHTMTKLTSGDILLVGGRLNPSKALRDCWLLNNKAGHWEKVDELPFPRYRHSAVCIGNGQVLVYGGMVEKEESQWILWESGHGWKYVHSDEVSTLSNRFSACMEWDSSLGKGVILGGMNDNNRIQSDAFTFEISSEYFIKTQKFVSNCSSLARYGSRSILRKCPDGSKSSSLIIAGGVSPYKLFDREDIFVSLDLISGNVRPLPIAGSATLPMFVGFNMEFLDNQIITYGGGCVCFSFGSFWDDIHSVSFDNDHNQMALSITEASSTTPGQIEIEESSHLQKIPIIESPPSADVTKSIIEKGLPTLFRNADIGSCVDKWKSPEYLTAKVGSVTKVVVHVSNSKALNFQSKNFEYKSMNFEEFVEKMFRSDDHVYLRSLSRDKPKDSPALFREDFPGLADDFHLPEFIDGIERAHFSSPLRLSSANTSMWLHYDVTANVLCQILGVKRVRLYPPQDIIHLSFPPGSSSSTIENIFNEPLDSKTHPVEIFMRPGDIIFIPAMWLHATQPLETSISLNFFWKDLDLNLYAAGKDIYGNRDISAYEDGRKMINRLISGFDHVPDSVRKFYLLRLAEEIKEHI